MNWAETLLAILTGGLCTYALGHYVCALVFSTARLRRDEAATASPDAVTVLVPAKDEGESALATLRSIVAQDHRGTVEAWLLVRDDQDSSLAFIEAASDLPNDERRKVRVCLIGQDPKAAKIVSVLDELKHPYVAILDADHVAQPQWIRTSLTKLEDARSRGLPTRMVQGRRYPRSARGFFRLWDSLHQHVGCELFNVAFERLGLSVFFTGTTAIMETALLREFPLREVVTEDIDLSYRSFFAGEMVVSEGWHGSAEEVSPDLYSFLARRRRWANGHTQAFLRQLPNLFRARLPFASKLQFLFHGTHYLVVIPVYLLHALIGVLIAPDMSRDALAGSLLAALLVSIVVIRSQRTTGFLHTSLEYLLAFTWLAPAAMLLTRVTIAILLGDPDHADLPFPDALGTSLPSLAIAAFIAPLVVLTIGLWRFGQFGVGTFVGMIATYPAAFYLDGLGALLGALDRLFASRRWRPVARDVEREHESVGLRESWRFGGSVRLNRPTRAGALPSALLTAAFACFAFSVLGSPKRVIAIDEARCTPREADVFPWITRDSSHCVRASTSNGLRRRRLTSRRGSYSVIRHDPLTTLDASFWVPGDATFPCNESFFRPGNVETTNEGTRFILREETHQDRVYTSGSLATKDDDRFLYGRFEVEMKPSNASGVVSAFFLYRFDPWQEIDLEFVGNDTTKILLNVYYNPGREGDLFNYGHLGTPVMVDLGFDAAEAFHRYAIEWDDDEIRWFVDDRLVHARRSGEPTPIPHLPMVFHMNTWATCSPDLAGPIDETRLPTDARFRDLTVSRFHPAPKIGLDALFSWGDPPRDAWMAGE